MKILLIDSKQGHSQWVLIWQALKELLSNGKRMWVTVEEERRTTPQNAKFHAMCGDLAKSHLMWAGKRRSTAQWKVLLVSGHAAATKLEHEIVPGLEGEFINLRESTALMSVARGASLIEYTLAFCAMHEITLSDPNDYRTWSF